jgi:hypothetical protein
MYGITLKSLNQSLYASIAQEKTQSARLSAPYNEGEASD